MAERPGSGQTTEGQTPTDDWNALLSLEERVRKFYFSRRCQAAAQRQLREKASELEGDLVSVRKLDYAVRELLRPAAPAPKAMDSKIRGGTKGPPKRGPPSRLTRSQSAAIPSTTPPRRPTYLGYERKERYRSLLLALRDNPRGLGEALGLCAFARAVPRANHAALASAVMGDIFGLFTSHEDPPMEARAGETAAVTALESLLESVNALEKRVNSSASSDEKTVPSVPWAVEPDGAGLARVLLFAYLDAVGKRFLESVLGPTLAHLATFNSGSAVGGTGTPSALDAVQKTVSRLVQRLLHSYEIVPDGVRVLASRLRTLTRTRALWGPRSRGSSSDGLGAPPPTPAKNTENNETNEQQGALEDGAAASTTNRSRRESSKNSASSLEKLQRFFFEWFVCAVRNPDAHRLCRWRPLAAGARRTLGLVADLISRLVQVDDASSAFPSTSPNAQTNDLIATLRPRVQLLAERLEGFRASAPVGAPPESKTVSHAARTKTSKGRAPGPIQPLVVGSSALRVVHTSLAAAVARAAAGQTKDKTAARILRRSWVPLLAKCGSPVDASSDPTAEEAFFILDPGLPELKEPKFSKDIFPGEDSGSAARNRVASALLATLAVATGRLGARTGAHLGSTSSCTGIIQGLRLVGQRHFRLGAPGLSTLLIELAHLLEVNAVSLGAAGAAAGGTRGPRDFADFLSAVSREFSRRLDALRMADIEWRAAHQGAILDQYRTGLRRWKERLVEALVDYRVRMTLRPILAKVKALRQYVNRSSIGMSSLRAPRKIILKGHTGPQRALMGSYTLEKSSGPDGASDAPPLYKHERENNLFLYYYKAYGLWLVGTVPGRHNGWLFVASKAPIPTMVQHNARWTFWDKANKKWNTDAGITVEAADAGETVNSWSQRQEKVNSTDEEASTAVVSRRRSLTQSLHRLESLFNMPASALSGGAAPAAQDAAEDGKAVGVARTCGGRWPSNLDDDHFLCDRCTSLLKKHKKMVHKFMNKYAANPPAFPTHTYAGRVAAAALQSERVSPVGSRVSVRVADYVIAAIYPQLFVPCKRAHRSFSVALSRLADRFPAFLDMYCAMGGRRRGADATKATETQEQVPSTQLGDVTVQAAVMELLQLCEATSVVEKLDGFSRCKSVITTALRSPAVFPALGGDTGADAYMPLLAYAVVSANPVHLLSHLQFIRLMHPDSLSVKDFVDVCVAVKALFQLDERYSGKAKDKESDGDSGQATKDKPEPASAAAELRTPPQQRADAGARSTAAARTASAGDVKRRLDENANEGLVPSLYDMGFDKTDVDDAVRALGMAADAKDSGTSLTKAAAFLTDIQRLREMGYGKEESLGALMEHKTVKLAVQSLLSSSDSGGEAVAL